MISRRPRAMLVVGLVFLVLGAPGPARIIEPLLRNAMHRTDTSWQPGVGFGAQADAVTILLTFVFAAGVTLIWTSLRRIRGE